MKKLLILALIVAVGVIAAKRIKDADESLLTVTNAGAVTTGTNIISILM